MVVTDALPAGVTFVGASGDGADNGGVVSWILGTLTSGQVSNLTVTVTAPAGGTLTNTANVSSPTADPNRDQQRDAARDDERNRRGGCGSGQNGRGCSVLATSNLTYTISA